MTPRFIPVLMLAALASSALIFESTAHAAAPEAAKPESATDAPAATKPDAPAGEAGGPDDSGAAKASNKDAPAGADAEASGSPIEESGKTYRAVGLRYRAVIVPKFMMNLFGSGGRTVLANGFGPEFTIRKDAFEYDFAAWYTSYAMAPTPFKAKSDGAQAWELVESQVKVLYLTADFLWSHDLVPEFAVNYGVGAGLGVVWGDLIRNQAYNPGTADTSTGDGYQVCGKPMGTADGNCAAGKHYNYLEPSWSGGGSKPIVFPWLVLQTGLRYKPHKNFIARLDAGFGTSGFFLGLGADYGL
jgi:hypothetical protein